MRYVRLLRLWAVIAVLALAVAGCGQDGGGDATGDQPGAGSPTAGETATGTSSPTGGEVVMVKDNFFEPETITVSMGTTVTWEWEGSQPHNVVELSTPPKFDSGDAKPAPATFTHTFDEAGTFEYFCEVHGKSMSGKVTVT